MHKGNVSDPDFPNLRKVILSARREKGVWKERALQKTIYKALMADNLDPWPAFFSRKLIVLELEPGLSYTHASSRNFLELSNQLPMQARLAALKSWANSWSTSERYHEDTILPCVFGCGGRDTVAHYITCDILWTIAYGCTRPQIANLYCGRSIKEAAAQRVCLSRISSQSILMCTVVFKVYHALKLDYRAIIDKAVELNDFGLVWDKVIDLVQIFAKELGVSDC